MRARLSRQICDQHTTPDRPSVVHRADRQVGADLCRIDRRPGLTALITLVRERFGEAAKIGRGAGAGDLGRRAARPRCGRARPRPDPGPVPGRPRSAAHGRQQMTGAKGNVTSFKNIDKTPISRICEGPWELPRHPQVISASCNGEWARGDRHGEPFSGPRRLMSEDLGGCHEQLLDADCGP